MIIPTDEQILKMGRYWKKQLGISPYRMFAEKDFAAGATWLKNLLSDPMIEQILEELDKEE